MFTRNGENRLWRPEWDNAGRSLLGLCPWVVNLLMPDRVEGFLIAAFLLCTVNALLLWAILRLLLPTSGAVPLAGALLLLASPADPSRFFVMWTTDLYWTALFFFLLAVWLFLLSYERQSRALLVSSCFSLGMALLTSEGLFPLAVLAVTLLWLVRHRGRYPLVWGYAWLATIAMLATRFGIHLLHQGAHSYQAQQSAEALHQPVILLTNLLAQLKPAMVYFAGPRHLAAYAGYWLAMLVPIAAGLWLTARGNRPTASRRPYVWGVVLAATTALFGVLPFVHLRGAFRTQFFAAPGYAALLAMGLGLVATWVRGRAGSFIVPVCTALLVADATVGSLGSQETIRRASSISFEKTVHVFQQVHGLCPTPNDMLIVFLLDDPGKTPLGMNYACWLLSDRVYGAPALQANYTDPLGVEPLFEPDRVVANRRAHHITFSYDKVVAFRLALDGTVHLLRELPRSLLPPAASAWRYNPLACLRPGVIGPLPYLRYSSNWMNPLDDVLDTHNGFVLGQNWRPLQREGGELSRWAEDGAEIFVNPAGQAIRYLEMEVEPASEQSKSCRLQVRDDSGTIVAESPVVGRQAVRLSLPLESGRVAAFHLSLCDEQRPLPQFRVLRVHRG